MPGILEKLKIFYIMNTELISFMTLNVFLILLTLLLNNFQFSNFIFYGF